MKGTPWDVEPIFGQRYDDFRSSVVFFTVVYQPGRHLCRTAVRHQLFFTDCHLQKGHECHTILEGNLQQQDGQWWIRMGEDTHVFPRPAIEMQGLYRVVDVCSGIGAVTKGFEACDAEILCHVDSNEQFVQWKKARTEKPCILGNVAHASTVSAVARCVNRSHILSAGISCQPFSALGDGRQGEDPRSESFTGTMMMGFYLGCIMFLLECTKEAYSSGWIQEQLSCFSQQTGYQVQQTVLHLHEMWPAKRTRWWAVVAHAAFPVGAIPAMPTMRFMPSIIHVLKNMLPMKDEELQQLMLSCDEFEQFCKAKGGIVASLIDVFKALPTATHSWGSQLVGCLCKCRPRGFSKARLEEKGLYAVLIPLMASETVAKSDVQAARHPHPQEVALLNGLKPSHVTPTGEAPLRLELAGVGQLASPLQGAWVLANVIYQAAKQKLHDSDLVPRHIMANMCRELLRERDLFWGVEGMTKSMRIFHQEVESLDTPKVWKVPDAYDMPSSDDEQTNDPPTLFQAKPLPRLGCGGPSQCNDNQGDHMPRDQKVCSKDEAGQCDPTNAFKPRSAHVNGSSTAQAGMTSENQEQQATTSGTHVPPTPFHAMPLPRLGCGGPSQGNGNNMHNMPRDKNGCSHDEAGHSAAVNAAEPRLAHMNEEPIQAGMTNQEKPVIDSDTHVPPTPFHAKPLPRLGCGGPSRYEMCENEGNQGIQETQLSQSDGASQCMHDPYEEARSDSQSECLQPETSPTAKDRVDLAAFLKGEASSAAQTETASDFYDDPEFDQKVVQQLSHQEIASKQTPFQLGGVPGFAVKRKQTASVQPAKQQKCAPAAGETEPSRSPVCEEVSLKPTEDTTQPEKPSPGPALVALGDDLITVKVVTSGEGFFTVQMRSGTTAAMLIEATNKQVNVNRFRSLTTLMGSPFAHDAPLLHDSWYYMQSSETHHVSREKPAKPGFHEAPPVLKNEVRAMLLWEQKGWVATDEMEYYMYMLECYRPSTANGILELQDKTDSNIVLTAFLLRNIKDAGVDPNSCVKAAVILHKDHWTPVVVKVYGNEIQVWTTNEGQEWMQPMFEASVGSGAAKFYTSVMPHAFQNDCGFQSIGWIISVLMDETTAVPFSEKQAEEWRQLFYGDLLHTNQAQTVVHQPLALGGAMSTKEHLQALVVEHGVAMQRSKECAEQLMQALGSTTVQNILQSPKPWADLKARASLQKPPIRIVLADELSSMLKAKAQTAAPVGKKSNKMKQKNGKKAPLQLHADQLCVPHAVFKQTDGTEISQISTAAIAPGSQGVALTNIAEALPYFSLTEPVSPQGVALLILEFDDPRLPPNHQVLKVPVQCKETKDPLILKVAIVQLGHQQVRRNLPTQTIEVPEVPNMVVRLVIFKDQFGGSWEEFIKSPVKHLMQQEPFRSLQQQDVIDVWDRQYMTTRMTKVPPEDAVMFSVNMRVSQEAAETIAQANGVHGTYVEPRSADGRNPDDRYKVVWLPRKTFGEAQVSQKTSKMPTTLVRQADRYGLRVESKDAEILHQLHRPDLVFIPGSELTKYRVGPMPFGSTKQSLVHVFTKWEWKARPLAPQGQAKDRSGVMWLVQASEPPSHWIFQLSHGDVLISPEEKGIPAPDPPQAVLASSRTLQALQATAPASTSDDPWIHYDPWTKPAAREMPTSQMVSMETRIEQNVITKLKKADVDMPQTAEDKVTDLESRLEQLSQTVHTHQQETAKQHQVVQNQLRSLDQKVDQQQGVFQTTLEAKLEQQMQRIEQLFSKRQRTNE